MNYKIVELQEKTAAGISARTNNSSPEMSAVIGGLWEKFYGEIYRQIPHKASLIWNFGFLKLRLTERSINDESAVFA